MQDTAVESRVERRGSAAPLDEANGAVAAGLHRRLRTRDAAALTLSNVIGVGIFTTPGIVASMVPNPTAMLLVWAAGGLLAFAGAIAYAELAKLCPRSGGEYNYLRQAFGPLAGFLSGWVSLVAGFSGAIAASAVALATYLGHYLPAVSSQQPLISIPLVFTTLPLSARSLTAASIILLFGVIHGCGIGLGRLAQNTLALLILGIIVCFSVSGFAFGKGSMEHFQSASAAFSGTKWLLALIPVMFTYSGWNAACYVSEEAIDPERTVGRALAIGTTIVIVVYLALNILFVYALPVVRLASAINVGDAAAQALFGIGGAISTPALIVALAGAISSMTIAGPRVYFAMARDGAFLRIFSRIHRQFHTPVPAIALQTVWSVLLVIVGGFEQILIYTGFAVVLSSAVAVVALFTLNRRIRTADMPAWTKILAGLFIAASFAMVIDAVAQAPRTSLMGLGVMVAGVPVFLWSRKRQSSCGAGIAKAQELTASTEATDCTN